MTETGSLGTIEAQMKLERAKKIAAELTNHSKWRSHGRSIKIKDLEEIGLKIKRVDDDAKLAENIYRIQTVCRLLFESTSTFKIFATQDNKIFKQAVPVGAPRILPGKPTINAVEIEQKCPKCGKKYNLYAKLVPNPKLILILKIKDLYPSPRSVNLFVSVVLK